MTTRRALLQSALLALPLMSVPKVLAAAKPSSEAALAGLEARHGGRLGVALFDTGSGRELLHRGHERFAMCSTFKLLLAAQVLAAVDDGRERLDRKLTWTDADLISWSPVLDKHDGKAGLSIATLCEAIMTISDNTAANLLLAEHGGPAGLTAWLRTIDDRVTRLDRNEPALNEAAIDDPRDTSSPAAMVATMHKLLLGDVLGGDSRRRLTRWLVANQTGDRRLRAGVPSWRVGDKTGTSSTHVSNDIGILWPPGGAPPILAAVFYAESRGTPPEREAVIADVGRFAVAWVQS